jgi:hypothetical protein
MNNWIIFCANEYKGGYMVDKKLARDFFINQIKVNWTAR